MNSSRPGRRLEVKLVDLRHGANGRAAVPGSLAVRDREGIRGRLPTPRGRTQRVEGAMFVPRLLLAGAFPAPGSATIGRSLRGPSTDLRRRLVRALVFLAGPS